MDNHYCDRCKKHIVGSQLNTITVKSNKGTPHKISFTQIEKKFEFCTVCMEIICEFLEQK